MLLLNEYEYIKVEFIKIKYDLFNFHIIMILNY